MELFLELMALLQREKDKSPRSSRARSGRLPNIPCHRCVAPFSVGQHRKGGRMHWREMGEECRRGKSGLDERGAVMTTYICGHDLPADRPRGSLETGSRGSTADTYGVELSSLPHVFPCRMPSSPRMGFCPRAAVSGVVNFVARWHDGTTSYSTVFIGCLAPRPPIRCKAAVLSSASSFGRHMQVPGIPLLWTYLHFLIEWLG